MIKRQLNPKQDAARRLKIVAGHIRKIIDMVESDTYCIDVLQQTVAVRSAVKKVEEILLINHLNHCLVRAIKAGGKDQALTELTEVLRKMN